MASEDRIAVFRRDTLNYSLEALPHLDCHVEGSPGAMCHMRLPSGQQRMYCVCSRGGVPGVSAIGVHEDTGGLVELGWVPAAFDDFSSYLSTDRTGSFLFSAYYSAGGCSVHRILADGTIGELIQRHVTAPQAHAIDVDATNSLVLVPHVDDGNAIYSFRLDISTGNLTPLGFVEAPEISRVDQARYDPDHISRSSARPVQGPRHLVFHPSISLVYVTNEQGNSISTWRFDSSSGSLVHVDVISTVPDGFRAKNGLDSGCAQLRLHPNGRFLYAPNRDMQPHDTIAVFAIDEDTGALSVAEGGREAFAPCEQHSRAIALDEDGRCFFCAGTKSGLLHTFRVDKDGAGGLQQVGTVSLGANPMWIIVTQVTGSSPQASHLTTSLVSSAADEQLLQSQQQKAEMARGSGVQHHSTRRLSDESVFDDLSSQGYAILPNYISGLQLRKLQTAVQNSLLRYEDLDDRPPVGTLPAPNAVPSRSVNFPFDEPHLNNAIVDDPDVHSLARRWLGSENICCRGASASVRYPGFTDSTGRHTDGFSLLPTAGADRSHAQLKFWYYVHDVGPGQAPISFWPTKLTDEGPLVCGPEESFQAGAGSLAVFTIFTHHSRSNFTAAGGERYVYATVWGRSDYNWQGTSSWVPHGFSSAKFVEFIGSLSPSLRTLFHFPPVGHDFYSEVSLRALEERYPGWNRTREYTRTVAFLAEEGRITSKL